MIAVRLIVQIFISLETPLTEDEMYYWYWSQHLAWAYPEHPPMIAFYYRFVSELLGEAFYVYRLFSLFLLIFLSFVLYFFGKYLTGKKWTGWLLVIIFYFLPFFLGSALIVTTDTLLLFFLFLSLFFYTRAFFPCGDADSASAENHAEEKGHLKKSGFNYFFAGLFMGGAVLAKLSSFLVMMSIVVYAFFSKKRKYYLKNPYFYLSFFVVFVIFFPCFWWNVQNDFVMLRQLNFMTTKETNSFFFRVFYQNQFFLAGPLWMILLPIVVFLFLFRYYRVSPLQIFRQFFQKFLGKSFVDKSRMERGESLFERDFIQEKTFFFAFIVFFQMNYLIWKSFFSILHPNWSLFVLVSFCPLGAIFLGQIKRKNFYIFLSGYHAIVTAIVIVLGYFLLFLSPEMLKRFPSTAGTASVFYAYKVFEEEFRDYYEEKMEKDWLIAGNNYQIPSLIHYYWRPSAPAVTIRIDDYHYTIFDVLFDENDEKLYVGKDIYYVLRQNKKVSKKVSLKSLNEICLGVEKIKTFSSKLYGQPIAAFDLYKCRGFLGSHHQPAPGKSSIISRLFF